MQTVSTDGTTLHYAVDGEGPPVVFVTEAGLGGWSWGWQHRAVAGPYRSVVWDLRGTGRSERPPGPYAMETLVADLEAILAAVDARAAHVVGAGLGGAIALRAARASTRIETVTVVGTPADETAFDGSALVVDRDETSQGDGVASDGDAFRRSTEALLSADFRAAQPAVVDGIVDWRRDGDADAAATRDQLAAFEEFDATDWGYEVTTPTAVVHGTDDAVVPVESAERLADALPNGAFVPIDGAAHLPQIERSRAVNDHLRGFLNEHTDE
ncbi:alpha/beta fold hydrolase [Halovivax cerinus]|uniref:Alpha/beta fold hydrolase n=1 Tax=Halovivax cerinus TaxID=1487865 RepID=A0ABD5NSX8_9EURY|nr:alpha/beta hydrolase [Halovivax cerinus]